LRNNLLSQHFFDFATAPVAAKLDLPADASAALVGYMLNMNKLATAGFKAKYGR
jgi:hypothetical protein